MMRACILGSTVGRCALSLAIAAVALTRVVQAANSAVAFEEANKLFEQERYADAAKAYRTLLDSGAVSPALLFNLGNACFKSGRVGEAIIQYRRALAFAPRDPDILANLEFVRSSVPGGGTGSRERWRRWLGRLSLDEWTILSGAGLWSWMLLLAAGTLRQDWRRSTRPFCLAAGLATCTACAALTRVAWDHLETEPVVVVVPEASVRNGPLPESQVFFQAKNGAEFLATDRKGDWIRVEDSFNRAGWIQQDQVAFVHPSQKQTLTKAR